MMNEINDLRGIWRGKRKDNGEWVQGSLLRSGNGYIDIIPINNTIYENDFSDLCVSKWYVVDPETLGECTGLTDTNGKFIFEGDICTVSIPNIADDEYGVVKFDENEAVFVIDYDTYTINFCDNINSSAAEVIGNIHDTPNY